MIMPVRLVTNANLVFVCIVCCVLSFNAVAHRDHGRPEKPITLVDVPIRLHDGSGLTLQELLAGKITALQRVFTRCSSICPIQASVFKAIESEPAIDTHDYQLLSISVDPEYDNPEFLAQWRKRWSASENITDFQLFRINTCEHV